MATIRPMPYWGCITDDAGPERVEVDRAVRAGGPPAPGRSSAAVVSRNCPRPAGVAWSPRLRGHESSRLRPRPARAARSPSGRGLHRLVGQLGEEPRRDRRLPLAPELADPAVAQVELALGPGDARRRAAAAPPPARRRPRWRREWGRRPCSRPTMKTTGNSSPLAACRVIRVTAPVSSSQRSTARPG